MKAKKHAKTEKFILDLSFRLCYSMDYLSDERLSFCAHFSKRAHSPPSTQGGNARPKRCG